MHCGKKDLVAISFLKSASLPGLLIVRGRYRYRNSIIAQHHHVVKINYRTASVKVNFSYG